MSDLSKVDIDKLRLTDLKKLFGLLESAFKELGIDFYLIGALARDSWLSQKDIVVRGTKDVDFAVCIANAEVYNELRGHLEQNFGFYPSPGSEFSMISSEKMVIDLLPFGEIENQDREVLLDGKGLAHIALDGFLEVYQNGVKELTFDGEFDFKVASLPAIVLLKLIAYDDRPQYRTKDLIDIRSILKYYDRIEDTLIFDKHFDVLEKYGVPSEYTAAKVIGREIGEIIVGSSTLKERILSILQQHIDLKENSEIAQIWVQGMDEPIVEDGTQLLSIMYNGILEGNSSQDQSSKT